MTELTDDDRAIFARLNNARQIRLMDTPMPIVHVGVLIDGGSIADDVRADIKLAHDARIADAPLAVY